MEIPANNYTAYLEPPAEQEYDAEVQIELTLVLTFGSAIEARTSVDEEDTHIQHDIEDRARDIVRQIERQMQQDSFGKDGGIFNERMFTVKELNWEGLHDWTYSLGSRG